MPFIQLPVVSFFIDQRQHLQERKPERVALHISEPLAKAPSIHAGCSGTAVQGCFFEVPTDLFDASLISYQKDFKENEVFSLDKPASGTESTNTPIN
jgi:hypothetical protein